MIFQRNVVLIVVTKSIDSIVHVLHNEKSKILKDWSVNQSSLKGKHVQMSSFTVIKMLVMVEFCKQK